jgi:hypothetical protein
LSANITTHPELFSGQPSQVTDPPHSEPGHGCCSILEQLPRFQDGFAGSLGPKADAGPPSAVDRGRSVFVGGRPCACSRSGWGRGWPRWPSPPSSRRGSPASSRPRGLAYHRQYTFHDRWEEVCRREAAHWGQGGDTELAAGYLGDALRHGLLKRKYERAMADPWGFVPPDPPEAD